MLLCVCVCVCVCIFDGRTLYLKNINLLITCAFEAVSHPPTIQANVRSAIGGKMSLFCLGFGNDVDYSFLDVMSKQNKGLARRIFEGSDATLQLQVEGLSYEYGYNPYFLYKTVSCNVCVHLSGFL